MHTRTRRPWMTILALTLTLAVLSACGGSTPAAPAQSQPTTAPVPAATAAPAATPAAPAAKAAAPAASPAAQADQPTKGGSLRIATIGEPPALDAHFSTATITSDITRHMFEGLMALTNSGTPAPMLADKVNVSADGLTTTFTLRQGVLFHNGKELDSADVAASLKRWGSMQSLGKQVFSNLTAINTPDKYTVEIVLTKPSGIMLWALGSTGHIFPKEIAEKYQNDQLKEWIGTGPYKFVEWIPDRHIKQVRWEKYAARTDPWDGEAGNKPAYLDELLWIPTPDDATRMALLESGGVHVNYSVPGSQYTKVLQLPNAKPWIVKGASYLVSVFNNKEGIMTNRTLRKAMQAAMHVEPVIEAAYGHPDLWRASHGLMQPEHTDWFTDAGKEHWNNNDPEKAKRLMQEAGYKGEPIRWLTTREYAHHYNGSLVAVDQFKRAGFNINLLLVDWATVVSTRSKSAEWDIFVTGVTPNDEPGSHVQLLPTWPGWYAHPKHVELLAMLDTETDQNKRRQVIYPQVQQLFYEEAPTLKWGDQHQVRAYTTNVKGIPDNLRRSYYAAAWLSR